MTLTNPTTAPPRLGEEVDAPAVPRPLPTPSDVYADPVLFLREHGIDARVVLTVHDTGLEAA